MEPNMGNPAGRLRRWLDALDDVRSRGDKGIMEAAAPLVGADPNTMAGRTAVMRLGVTLADLCAETRLEVHALPSTVSAELLLSDFDQIERAVDYF
ncbi:hypothetical protein ACFU7D_01095 [Nocardioides sp. NPDC057577]|uniref:hypothetical protein n=1 Tax=Nocardioides sp. NPDC057577 TaxID=3346171 RepID=UPI00366EBC10